MNPRRSAGFSYIEVMVATLLVAVAMVPALDSLEAGSNALRGAEARTQDHHHLASKLDEVLAERIDVLEAEAVAAGSPTTPTSYSDPPASARRRLVYLAAFDGDDADTDADPLTGGDVGLVWVRVELQNTELSFETVAKD